MYNKRYYIEKVEEFGEHNSTYDDTEGAILYPAYLKEGERGWFLWEEPCFGKWRSMPHRYNTSTIKSIEYIDDRIVVETQNTRLTLKLIEEE